MTVDEHSQQPTFEPSRRAFASLLWRLADLVQAAERRRSFRAKAYRQAIWSLDSLPPSLDASDEELLATPGIGPGVTSLINEYRATGSLNQLVPLEAALPMDTPRLRRLPRVTPKMLHEMKTGLAVETTEDLLAAIETGSAETLSGVGDQTLSLWRKILELPPHPGSVPAHEAWVTAVTLAEHIGSHVGTEVVVSGAVRRVEEWVDHIDLLAVGENPGGLEAYLEATAALDGDVTVEEGVMTARSHTGTPVRVHQATPARAGTALLWTTGPPGHAGRITDRPFATEFEAYASAGLPTIPAPARGLDLPVARAVVTQEDLKGDLQLHTNRSPDGHLPLETILEMAVARGYAYLLVTDHTEGLRFGGMGSRQVAEQAEEIEVLRQGFPSVTLFHGAELNIGVDGGLDLPEEALAVLDFAVAGIHSHFSLDRDAQTERVLAGMAHPVVKVLAHPFGRRIGIRPALDIDMDTVIDAAVENGIALESNGHRDRLDLPADWIARAAAKGAVFAANSDAHRVPEVDNVGNAIATLQHAGINAERVVNTFPLPEFLDWIDGALGSR